jgi:hypothetical protein
MKKNLFVISESEKERILGMHKSASERHYLSEQSTTFNTLKEDFDQTSGVYTTKHDQGLKATVDFGTKFPKRIPAGTKVYHNYNAKNNKIVLGNTGVVAYCDRNLFIYNTSIDDLKNDGFMKVIKSIFCNGNKLKTWDQLTNKVVKKNVTPVEKVVGGGGGGSLTGSTEISGSTGTTGSTEIIKPLEVSGTTVTSTLLGTTGQELQGVVDTTNMASRKDIRQGYRQEKRDVRELEKELRQAQNTLQRLGNKMTPEQTKQYQTKVAQLQNQINQSAT